ncbi:MAG: hypothetical protein ACRD21_17445 [Vicinamibacteria bacterium]
MKLYWVETPDHAEDWLMVAPSESRAEKLHEQYEGYERGDAEASLVAAVPQSLEAPMVWPLDELLEACGVRILRPETPRVVEIAGRKFTEGYLEHEIRQIDDDAAEALGRGRPNRTEKHSRH